MSQMLIVGCGGFCGAIARFALTGWMHRSLPKTLWLATLAVNVLGCFAIGVLMALVVTRPPDGERALLSEPLRQLLIAGFLGSFTTFSTFGYETLHLLQDQAWREAFWNVAGSLCLGLAAAWLGWTLTRALVA